MVQNTFRKTLVCALCCLTTTAFGQKGFQFGIRYTMQATTLFNKADKDAGPELDKSSTMSFISGGLAVGYYFNTRMGIEMEILHSRQGQEYTGTNMQTGNGSAYNRQVFMQALLNGELSTSNYQAKAELNSIKIPILFKLATDNTRRLYYTLSAGPQVNILGDAVYELNKEDVELPGTNVTPTDAYRKVTFDGVVALGAAYNLSRHFVLSAQARFDYGFQDIEKKDLTFTYAGMEQKYYDASRPATHNGTAALALGLSYKL